MSSWKASSSRSLRVTHDRKVRNGHEIAGLVMVFLGWGFTEKGLFIVLGLTELGL